MECVVRSLFLESQVTASIRGFMTELIQRRD